MCVMHVYKIYRFKRFTLVIGKILADYMCCVCGKRKTAKGGSGYEKLQKCETENGAKTLQQAAIASQNSHLCTEIAGGDWQTILAKELFYHRTCYLDITKKRDAKVEKLDHSDKSFQEVIEFIKEKVIHNCEVLRLAELSQLYIDIKSKHCEKECEPGSSSV